MSRASSKERRAELLEGASGVRLIDQHTFASALARAHESARGRTNVNLHPNAEDSVHRFLNVMTKNTYVTPHRHLTPPKSETFLVLRGEIGVFLFDDSGTVSSAHRLGDPLQREFPCCIDVPAGMWHSIAPLSEEAICFEVKKGPWLPSTDKEFAPFAPHEGVASKEECARYRDELCAALFQRLDVGG